MNREERIEKARQMAAKKAPLPGVKAQQQAGQLARRLANVGASQAQRHVTAAAQSGGHDYLSPVETPDAWGRAVELARLVTITRAKRRDTITYGEIRWVIYDELRMLIDDEAFAELVAAVNDESDGVLLGSLIVHPDDGRPSDDFLLAAMERGFELHPETLQRQVYEHFR